MPCNRAGRRGDPWDWEQKPWASVARDPRAATLQPGSPQRPLSPKKRQSKLSAALPSCPQPPADPGQGGRGARECPGEAGAARPRSRHGPRACGCARCHQRQPHLRAKLRNASSWPTSPRLMTAYTGASPLSQRDPNAYFTSTCRRAPFLPAPLSSRLPHPALLPAPRPSQLFSFFFCHTYPALATPRVAPRARVHKCLCHFLIAPGAPPLPGGPCTCHSSS